MPARSHNLLYLHKIFKQDLRHEMGLSEYVATKFFCVDNSVNMGPENDKHIVVKNMENGMDYDVRVVKYVSRNSGRIRDWRLSGGIGRLLPEDNRSEGDIACFYYYPEFNSYAFELVRVNDAKYTGLIGLYEGQNSSHLLVQLNPDVNRETKITDSDQDECAADVLSIALKEFAVLRKDEAWCADNTEGDESTPRAGWLANVALRRTLPMTNNLATEAQIKSWFQDLVYPNGSNWLEGVEIDDSTMFGAYVNWLVNGGVVIPRPNGFPRRLEVAVRAVVNPDCECLYDANIHEALKFLSLVGESYNSDFTDDDYTAVKGIAAVLKRRLNAIGEKCAVEWDAAARPPCAKPDSAPPDYLTVNEFLWFVKLNQKQISEKCEAKKMKAADYSTSDYQPTVKKPKVDVSKDDQVVLLRLAAALRAKPFAILAGHSGTGKSRMVRQLAYMTAAAHNHKVLFDEDEAGNKLKSPGNLCMVQVKPNWHDSTDLLGYYSELSGGFKGTEFVKFICKAYAYPDVPFFVCLDEMNLAPVEQYFAEYLSAIESRKLTDVTILDEHDAEKQIQGIVTDRLISDEAWQKKDKSQDFSGLGCELNQSKYWLEKYGLTIPRNLFVVGTVNMDESTNQFSRKVLDRAFTLEMTDADFKHFGEKNPEPTFDDFAGDEFADALLAGEVIAKRPEEGTPENEVFDIEINNLEKLQPILAGTSFVVAYRFANEYMLYENALKAMESVIDITAPSATSQTPSSSEGAVEESSVEGTVNSSSDGQTEGEASSQTATQTAATTLKTKPEAFDDMILMKVLPRITGDENMVMKIFVGETPAGKDAIDITDANAKGLVGLLGKNGASFTKMDEIVKRGKSNGSGTLTFWP